MRFRSANGLDRGQIFDCATFRFRAADITPHESCCLVDVLAVMGTCNTVTPVMMGG